MFALITLPRGQVKKLTTLYCPKFLCPYCVFFFFFYCRRLRTIYTIELATTGQVETLIFNDKRQLQKKKGCKSEKDQTNKEKNPLNGSNIDNGPSQWIYMRFCKLEAVKKNPIFYSLQQVSIFITTPFGTHLAMVVPFLLGRTFSVFFYFAAATSRPSIWQSWMCHGCMFDFNSLIYMKRKYIYISKTYKHTCTKAEGEKRTIYLIFWQLFSSERVCVHVCGWVIVMIQKSK